MFGLAKRLVKAWEGRQPERTAETLEAERRYQAALQRVRAVTVEIRQERTPLGDEITQRVSMADLLAKEALQR